MNRRKLMTISLGSALALTLANQTRAQTHDKAGQASLETVTAFMSAMGAGDMQKMSALMADDMVWHNEGDKSLPWIGETKGKQAIFRFLGVFSSNLKTTLWKNTDILASGDTVAVFGRMNGTTTKSG